MLCFLGALRQAPSVLLALVDCSSWFQQVLDDVLWQSFEAPARSLHDLLDLNRDPETLAAMAHIGF